MSALLLSRSQGLVSPCSSMRQIAVYLSVCLQLLQQYISAMMGLFPNGNNILDLSA